MGEKEAETETVAVRKQGEGDKGVMTLEEFVQHIQLETEKQLA